MTLAASPAVHAQIETPLAIAVRGGLLSRPKSLPSWLFYDEAGSRLFERITGLPEYYLTRTERGIFVEHALDIIAAASQGAHLRVVELGAGSAAKTCLLLAAAVEHQGSVLYEPIDVSASALDHAARRIQRETAGVTVLPRVMNYTNGLTFHPVRDGERRLVLYIGSSIGNFEPHEAASLLRRVRTALAPGDALLLGMDRVKDPGILLAAYDDGDGVTAAFNQNLLTRLNSELGADFELRNFEHRAIWNQTHSRIEMHLVSRRAQRAHLAALDLTVHFAPGETIHTENSYKYAPGQPESMLCEAGFEPASVWADRQSWFSVYLAQAT